MLAREPDLYVEACEEWLTYVTVPRVRRVALGPRVVRYLPLLRVPKQVARQLASPRVEVVARRATLRDLLEMYIDPFALWSTAPRLWVRCPVCGRPGEPRLWGTKGTRVRHEDGKVCYPGSDSFRRAVAEARTLAFAAHVRAGYPLALDEGLAREAGAHGWEARVRRRSREGRWVEAPPQLLQVLGRGPWVVYVRELRWPHPFTRPPEECLGKTP